MDQTQELFELGRRPQQDETLVVTCLKDGFIVRMKVYTSVRALMGDQDFWNDLIRVALYTGTPTNVIDDLMYLSDPSTGNYYFFIHVVKLV